MTYATTATNSDPIVSIVTLVISVVIIVAIIIANWKIFIKAGKPGWTSIVPIYNFIVLMQIIKKPAWWIFLYLVPLVNYIISLLVAIELAKAFGKSAVFGVILLWLFPVGYFILAFDNDKYIYGATAAPAPVPAAESVPVSDPTPQAPTAPQA